MHAIAGHNSLGNLFRLHAARVCIIDHLDYLQRIGITTLFLTPIFSAPSNHKYDATDFFRVDEQFGGEQALVELIEQLHNRKMYLFLDISFNHISDIHPWFVAAMRNEQPFRDFFISSSDFSKDEFDDTGIPDFFLREFRFGFTVEKLCEAIEDDKNPHSRRLRQACPQAEERPHVLRIV